MKYFAIIGSVIIVLVVLVTLLISVCFQEMTFQDAVARAITETSEAQSYRTAGNITYIDAEGETLEYLFESEFAAPDRSHSKARKNGNWSETISIGDESYIRNSDNPQWCQSPCQYEYDSHGRSVVIISQSLGEELDP